LALEWHPRADAGVLEAIVRAMKVLRNIVGSAGLLFMGYVFMSALPDVRRYIRISTM